MLFDGPHFQATDEGELVFLMSDGDSSRRPTEHEILEPEEENSTLHQNYYLRIPLEHADSQRWRTEVAKYLAPLVLGTTMGTLPWTLADFPQGYTLLLHKSPRRAEPFKARRDFYLYGATDVPFFASPHEFVKHAEWLMRGAPRTSDTRHSPRCPCKYCSSQHPHVGGRDARARADADAEANNSGAPGDTGGGGSVRSAHIRNLKSRAEKRQSVISRGLRRVRARVLTRIKNSDGDDEDVDELMEDVEEQGGERPEVDNGVGVDADVVDVSVKPEPTNVVPAADHGGTD